MANQNPRIRILTIEQSLDEAELDASPTRQVGRTFRSAPRAEAKVPVEQRLAFTDEAEEPTTARRLKKTKPAKAKLATSSKRAQKKSG